MSKFTPQEYAIFRHVWSLGGDSSKLDKYFIMRTNVKSLMNRLDSSHEFKTLLPYQNIAYEIECLDCSITYLKKIHETQAAKMPLLLSFRWAISQNMAICLVKLPHRKNWGLIDISRFEELV